jgi:predicted nucleic acid-binding protein
VDTGAWVGLVFARDQRHPAALRFFRSIATTATLITTNCVLEESYTLLAARAAFSASDRLHDQVASAKRTGLLTVVWATEALHDAAWAIFERHRTQRLSFVDCISIAVCQEQRATYAFTFDAGFSAAGITVRSAGPLA